MAECVEKVNVFGPTINLYPAWDGGARSKIEFDGNCYFGFATNTSTVGAVVGLNTADVGYSFSEITHGFRFNRGEFWIMEHGVNKQGPFPFADQDRFYIFRVGTDVLYIHKNDTDLTSPIIDPRYPGLFLPDPILYISAAPATGTVFLDSSLYQFNDYVYNEEGGEIWLPSLSFVSEEGNETIAIGSLGFEMQGRADCTRSGPAAGAAAYEAEILSQSPTLFYPMDELAAATDLLDAAGANDAPFTGGLANDLTVSPFDRGVAFTAGDYATVPATVLDFIHQATTYTIAWWGEYPNQGAPNQSAILAGNSYGSGGTGGRKGWGLLFSSQTAVPITDGVRFLVNPDNVNLYEVNWGNVIPDTGLHHYVLVLDAGTARLYVDGVDQGTPQALTTSGTGAADRQPIIGGLNWTTGPDTSGNKTILQMSFHNGVAFTAQDVLDAYNAPAASSRACGTLGEGLLPFTMTGNVPRPTEGTGQLGFILKGKADNTLAVEAFAIGSGELPFGGGLGDGKVGYDGIAGTNGGAIGNGIMAFSLAGTAYKANFVYGYGYLPFEADGIADNTLAKETVGRGVLPFLNLGISLGFYDNHFNIAFPTFGVEVQRFTEELSDTMIIIPTLAEGLIKVALLSDNFQLAAPITSNYAFNIGDRIVLVEELQQFSQQAVELLDSFGITTRQQIALAVNLSETMLGAGTFNVSIALEIADQLVATGVVETFYQATELLASSMALTDLTQAAFAVTVADGMALSSEILTRLALQAMLNDVMTLTDTAQEQLFLMAVFDDSLEISDSQELTARYFAELLDSAAIYTLVRTPAELAQGWVMNTEGNQPISEYDNYAFSSLAYGPRGTIGTTDEGVYDLSGDDDDGTPIDAALTSMMLDFGTSRMKRMSAAWVGYKANGELVLKVRAVDVDDMVEYCFVGRAVEGVMAPQENRFKLGKGLRSRYWQFELVNKDGADFELDQVELYPIRLDRRL